MNQKICKEGSMKEEEAEKSRGELIEDVRKLTLRLLEMVRQLRLRG